MNSKQANMSYWKKLWIILEKREKIQLAGILILQILGSLVEVIGLGAIPAFVLILANPNKILSHKIAGPALVRLNVSSTQQLLIWGSIFLISLFIIKNLYLFGSNIVRASYLRKLQVKYGVEIFERYMYADYTYLLSHNTAELMRNCVGEVNQVVIGILQGTLTLIMDIFLVFNISIVLFIIEPMITLISFLVIGSLAIGFLRISKAKLESLGKKAMSARTKLYLAVNQGLNGIKETRIMQSEEYFINFYRKSIQELAHASKQQIVINGTIKPLFETLAVAGLLIITLMMYARNRSMEGVIPVLSVFSIAMIRLLPAIREITTTLSTLRYSFVSIDPVYESRDIPLIQQVGTSSSPANDEAENQRIDFLKSLELRDVSYTYPNSSTQAISKISFQLKKGEVVAFVGSSGAGKTTLVDVIAGLLTAQTGDILVDGRQVNKLMRSWQKHMAYIPQFIYLSDESLINNIKWGQADTSDADNALNLAIKTAQLENLIKSLPQGAETVVGERGTRLSGGQRQRIGIARAVYRDPEVLLMDEATAALDNITEHYITDAIENMKGDRTMIIIAHRLSTVRNCDRLYMMEAGKIIAAGTYDELLRTSAEFRALHGGSDH